MRDLAGGMLSTLIILALIIGFYFSMRQPSDFDTSIQKVYVDKVYMNEKTRFTFITKGEKENKIWEISRADFHIYDDVKKGERMYVEYNKRWTGGSEFYDRVDIHIHNFDDIKGGGWNHGKFGRGQTTEIE